MLRKHLSFASLRLAYRFPIDAASRRTKPQASKTAKQENSFFDVATRESKVSSYWRMRVHISVQQAHLFLGLITPFHSHRYPPTDLHHHSHTTHCALIIDIQSIKIRPLTTSSHLPFFSSTTLQSQSLKWQALGGTAPCQLMEPFPNSSMSS